MVRSLKHFRDLIFGYEVHVSTDHQLLLELFRDKNLSGRLARWYLTILEYRLTFQYVPDRANVVADALSRNVAAIQEVENFSIPQLRNSQRSDPKCMRVYAFESGDESHIPHLPIPMSEFGFTPEQILRRSSQLHGEPVTQTVISDALVPVVLRLLHDVSLAAHPGKDKTLQNNRKQYYWLNLRLDVKKHVLECVTCPENKGHVPLPAPMLNYPTPAAPMDVIAIDLLQLPASHQGSHYALVCVDHFSRLVILAPLENKSAEAVAYALILMCFVFFLRLAFSLATMALN